MSLISFAYRIFLRAQERYSAVKVLVVPVRVMVFTVDTMLSAIMVLAWVIAYGLPRKILHRLGAGRTPASGPVVFLSQEGFTVAPTRIRSYFFAERIARLGVPTKVLAFWDDIYHFEHLPDRPIFGVERVFVALRAAHQLLADPPSAIVQQRPNYDLITSWALHWLYGTPVIFDIDDWIGDYMWFYPVRIRHVLPRCRSLVSVCVVSSRRLEEELGPIFPDLVKIPTYADTEIFQPRSATRANPEIVFGWNGTLFQEFMYESLILMIRAFARCCDRMGDKGQLAFEIAGTGAYLGLLEKTLAADYAKYPIRIKGWLDPRKMPEYLDGIDVGLYSLTMAKQGEASGDAKFILSKSPTKVFEYMAKGIPTISTRLGDVAQYIDQGVTGFCSDDVDELSEAFLRLAGDAELRIKMGAAARRQGVERYSMDAAAASYARVIAESRGVKMAAVGQEPIAGALHDLAPTGSAAKSPESLSVSAN